MHACTGDADGGNFGQGQCAGSLPPWATCFFLEERGVGVWKLIHQPLDTVIWLERCAELLCCYEGILHR